jgi:DNA-binding FrmR family transcriptional regulator
MVSWFLDVYPLGVLYSVYPPPGGMDEQRKESPVAASGEVKRALLTRLRRIEGQTRRLQRMVEEEKYGVEIMHQIAGVQSALQQVSLLLLENHLACCVTDAIANGQGEEKIREIMDLLKHYTRA